jgi:hypothetical protein
MDTKKLIGMLDNRDNLYSGLSQQIFKQLRFITDGINQYFEEIATNIIYDDINIVQDDILLITTKPVRNEFTDQLHQLSVGLPLSIVNSNSAEVIYKFLIDAEMARSQDETLSTPTSIKPISKITVH